MMFWWWVLAQEVIQDTLAWYICFHQNASKNDMNVHIIALDSLAKSSDWCWKDKKKKHIKVKYSNVKNVKKETQQKQKQIRFLWKMSRNSPFFFAKEQDGKSVGFLWSQGGDQFELEEVQIGVVGVSKVIQGKKITTILYLFAI